MNYCLVAFKIQWITWIKYSSDQIYSETGYIITLYIIKSSLATMSRFERASLLHFLSFGILLLTLFWGFTDGLHSSNNNAHIYYGKMQPGQYSYWIVSQWDLLIFIEYFIWFNEKWSCGNMIVVWTLLHETPIHNMGGVWRWVTVPTID